MSAMRPHPLLVFAMLTVGVGCMSVRYDHAPRDRDGQGGDAAARGDPHGSGDTNPPPNDGGDLDAGDGSAGDSPGGDDAATDPPPPALCSSPPCWLMPDSATTMCIDPSSGASLGSCSNPVSTAYGQDGSALQPAPLYEVHGERLYDRNTGLSWSPLVTNVNHAQAEAHCADLSLDGFDDWRLPHHVELISIADYGRFDSSGLGVVFDPTFFPGLDDNTMLWTQDSYPDNLPYVSYWAFYAHGSILYWYNDRNSAQAAMCTRGPPLRGNRLVATTQVVSDDQTALTWTVQLYQTDAWGAAVQHCQGLALAGYDDWRLPTFKELQSIVVTNGYSGIDAVFGHPPGLEYWTATPYGTGNVRLYQDGGRPTFAGILVTLNPPVFLCVRGP